jgi:hypothetical protein
MVAYPVPIQIDKLRHLRFSANDLADIEEVMGGETIGELLNRNRGIRLARAMLWAGLRHEDPALVPSRIGIPAAGNLIEIWFKNGGTIAGLFEKIDEAMTTASDWMGTKKEGAGPSPKQEDDGKNLPAAG